jgi:APA family basic amino acid/polyamine antiporter
MPQPVRHWWFPAAPVVFLIGCAVINLMILTHDPMPAVIGLVIVLVGDPVRRFFFSKTSVAADRLPQQISL